MIQQSLQRIRLLTRSTFKMELDVFENLEAEHLRIQLLAWQLRFTRNAELRWNLLKRLLEDVRSHLEIEEAVIYPAFEKNAELSGLILGAHEEHRQIHALVKELEQLTYEAKEGSKTGQSPSRFEFPGNFPRENEMQFTQAHAQLHLLMENLNHHMRHEEEVLFRKARQHFSEARLHELSKRIEQRPTPLRAHAHAPSLSPRSARRTQKGFKASRRKAA